jgi:imidazole glycerol-phosphate synthase subunit HisH
VSLVIIDYDASNLHSVRKALQHLGHRPVISNDPAEVAAADAVVLPGVGAANDAMRHLHELGLVEVLRRFGRAGKPFFGVCVGLQLLFEWSEENGGIDCLGLLPGSVRRFPPGPKVPQIGWNSVELRRPHPAFDGIPSGSYFYFVHSYYVDPADDVVLGTTDHGIRFPSVVAHRNLLGVQFHPEKSGPLGLRLYDNFARRAGLLAAELAATGQA